VVGGHTIKQSPRASPDLCTPLLGVVEELQENTEIMRRHEAHGRFWLLRKGNTEEKQTLK